MRVMFAVINSPLKGNTMKNEIVDQFGQVICSNIKVEYGLPIINYLRSNFQYESFRMVDPNPKAIEEKIDPNMMLSDHFSLAELIFSETALRMDIDNTPPASEIEKLKDLCIFILEPVREHFGVAFRPNSGWRGMDLNHEVGGSEDSQHCKAEAVDIEVPSVSNWDLAYWIKHNLTFDQLILEHHVPGIPTSGWVHVSSKSSGKLRMEVLTYANGKWTPGLLGEEAPD